MRSASQREEVRQRRVPSRYVSVKGKTRRAYRAYKQLLDTAEWLRAEANDHLANFNMTIVEHRLMELIYRRGPQYQMELSRRFRCSKQSVGWLIWRLEEFGWLKRIRGRLPAQKRVDDGFETVEVPKRKGSRKKTGRPIVRVFLTNEGRDVISEVMWKHAKYMKAQMRALDGREQETLSRLLRKLQRGDVVRFIREIKRIEWDEDWEGRG